MAARKKTDASYADAAGELDEILDEIEQGSADVDVLSEKVERAAELIKLCRDKLSKTELKVEKVVKDLAESEEEAGEA
ncbi:MAG: exodeoxyribonuclease VII small subunit [Planctomycetota bacterium]|jgi:exodeoxyribonuclease VII small subunit